jgi:Lamin Tail Domain
MTGALRTGLGLAGALALAAAVCGTAAHAAGGIASCTRESGPAGITAARWSGDSPRPPALAQPGFGTLEFSARDGKRLRAQFYRPSRFDAAKGALWFVMHGVDRDAARYIGAAAPVAERHQALAIVIEFSRRDYPASEDYTLGVTTRGNADESAAREGRWRRPEDYLYNEVERVFEAVRLALGGAQRGYHLFGHSAGAQFTHRLLTFVPCARVLGAVAANAGWYTLPLADAAQRFGMPYSLRGSAPEAADARALLAVPLTLLLGTRDTSDASSDALVRGTRAALAQGPNRLERGRHYFDTGQALARSLGVPFGWRLVAAPGAGHDVRQVVASAGHLLFARDAPVCTPSPAQQAGRLVIHQVLADPPPGLAGDANRDGQRDARADEFVELVNAGNTPLCLTGWTLEDAGGRGGHLFPLGAALAPGKAVVVFGGGVPTGGFGAEVHRATSARGLDLNRGGDVLTLRDAHGNVAQRLSWGDCAGQACAADHWHADLRLNGSLVRWPAADGAWRVHRDVAPAAYSAGSRTDGQNW